MPALSSQQIRRTSPADTKDRVEMVTLPATSLRASRGARSLEAVRATPEALRQLLVLLLAAFLALTVLVGLSTILSSWG
ncbi:MAG: hypothetical protein WCP26_15185 [Actinomycetes bacterium]